MRGAVHVGDCLEWLRSLPDESVDAVVTDPPYGLGREPDPREVLSAWLAGDEFKPGGSGFMGRAWDAFVPSPVVWAECFRVLKPGGHLLSFAGTRTYDWIVLGVRLAGFEVRDMLSWVYGSGFPKSLDVSKAIDKAAGAEREVVGSKITGAISPNGRGEGNAVPTYGSGHTVVDITAPATEAAAQWQGWGTALKPAVEPIVMARKPLSGTVAANVLEHGTGAINVDGCRIAAEDKTPAPKGVFARPSIGAVEHRGERDGSADDLGRWPANLIHDGSDEVVALFPQTSSGSGLRRPHEWSTGVYGMNGSASEYNRDGDTGSAARFFYNAKATRREREAGLEHLPRGIVDPTRAEGSAGRDNPRAGAGRKGGGRANVHPTVKPVALMRWLVRLVTPPGGLVIDPYLGSGTTGMAAAFEGVDFAGCELDTWHAVIAHERIAWARCHPPSDLGDGGEDDEGGDDEDVVPMQAALPLGG